ncbi:F0F1 ATP synthase subunit B [Alkalinema pantanalense CENA528]|uniref:F0F1 ATP synthase subunit B n=1 Tax=Alkalinema pantanalense TaxID=1620705 RepID=UPI003D6FFA56
MDIFLQLASGASLIASEMAEAAEGGFGFNFDIIEANLVNLAIVIGILVYFGRGFLSKTLGERSSAIEQALSEAERRRAETAKLLAAEQEKLKNAQAEAAAIVAKAEGDAQRAREAILANAAEEVARMKQEAAANFSVEQARILNELRVRIAEMAMQQAEAQLPGRLNDDAQQRLVDRSIALLGGQ